MRSLLSLLRVAPVHHHIDRIQRTLKEALAYGILVASYNVEDFSLERLKRIERADLDRRMQAYRKMLSF